MQKGISVELKHLGLNEFADGTTAPGWIEAASPLQI